MEDSLILEVVLSGLVAELEGELHLAALEKKLVGLLEEQAVPAVTMYDEGCRRGKVSVFACEGPDIVEVDARISGIEDHGRIGEHDANGVADHHNGRGEKTGVALRGASFHIVFRPHAGFLDVTFTPCADLEVIAGRVALVFRALAP